MPTMFNQRSSMLNNFPKFMVEVSKLCKPGPQASIFQHSNESEAGPEGGIRMPIMFIQRANMLNNFPKNSRLMHQNCACQGLRTPFSNTFLRLRSALRVVAENANKLYSEG